MNPSHQTGEELKARHGSGSAVIAGLGTIGSSVAQALARLSWLKRVLLADPDEYEEKNLRTQAIDPGAVGRPKVEVIAAQMRRLRPDIEVLTVQDRVEHIPWGQLRAGLFLGCLDSKAARRELNRMAGRLGANYIDAGVNGPLRLARVGVFPAAGEVCQECSWTRTDYEHLEVPYPCQGGEVRAGETNAPAYLGQLAAALQVMEGDRLMMAGPDRGEEGAQAFEVLIDGQSRKFYYSRFQANPHCRFPHGVLRTEWIHAQPSEVPLASLLPPGAALGAEGDVFVRDVVCSGCQARLPVLIRRRALRPKRMLCEGCGTPLSPLGFTMLDTLVASVLEGGMEEATLATAGFQPGDVFRIVTDLGLTTGPEVKFYELAVNQNEPSQ